MDKIKTIAKETRIVCEDFAARSKKYCFSRCEDLTAMCASASLVLKEVYDYYGIKADFWEKNSEECGHCWIKVEKLNIDITASQFGGPKVYIGKTAYRIRDWGRFHKIKHTEKIPETLVALGWPESQVLNKKTIDKLKNRVIKRLENKKK